jgi:perosamine synthetase
MILQIQPWIDDSELIELERVIKSTFITESTVTKEFEGLTRELTGSSHAISMTNGTAALYCSLKALGIGSGDEVIVPNITFIATANAVIMAGAIPVFCEIKADTFCIDLEWAERLVNKNTKAIIPVHLYGQAADMDQVMAFAQVFNLIVLEDAAQGVGVKFNGRHTGTFGQMGILSYYGNKTITCGEGGMVLTNDSELAKKVYRLKNHGRDVKGVFIHEHIGFNFSFTELQAAIGVAQMKKLPEIIRKKSFIYQRYRNEIYENSGLQHVYIDKRCTPVFWFTSILVPNAETLEKHLKVKGIQSRRFFYPLHMQPCYKNIIKSEHVYTVSEQVYKMGISIPSAYSLSEDQQTAVIQAINQSYI